MSSILPGFVKAGAYAQIFGKGKAIRLLGATSGTIDIASPAAPTPYTLTLPAALEATDKVLQVSSAGVLSLVDLPAATSPAGSGTEIQYRNAGAFGAVAGSSWDATTLALPKLSATSTTANQLTVAYDATYKVTLDVSAAGVMTLAGFKPSGTNAAAGAAYLDVPVSTGNATPGSLIFRSTVATTSGSTAQTLADTLTIANGRVGIRTASPDANLQVAGSFRAGQNASHYVQLSTDSDYNLGIITSAAGRLKIVCKTTDVAAFWESQIRFSIADFGFSAFSPVIHGEDNYIVGNANLTIRGGNPNNGAITGGGLRLRGGNSAYSSGVGYGGPVYLYGGNGIAGGTPGPALICHDGSSVIGVCGIATTAPDKQVEINSATGDCLRLTYNDANGSAANYADLLVSSGGNLTITPSGGVVSVTGDVRPATDDTYYLGKNDDDSPAAWKGVVLKDTTNGKYYRLEIISGVVTATDLTD